jgi:hypothetical protein
VIRGNTVRANTVGDVDTAYQQAGGAGLAFYSGIDVTPGIMDGNRVEDNLAADFGGGILIGEFLEGGQSVESPSLGTVENNVVVGNDAFDGGGIQANTTGVLLRNNTIVENIASSGSTNPARGGGIQVWTSHRPEFQLDLVNNIIAFNTAEDGTGGSPGQGGGLYVDASAAPAVRYEDLYGNVPNNVGGAKSDGDYIGSNGNVSVDPLFADRNARDYRLTSGSTLIEGGDNGETPGADFDGAPRPQDGDEDGTSIVDFGAYEFPSDFDRDEVPDWMDPDDDNDGILDESDCAPRNRAVTGTPEPVGRSLRIDKEAGATLRWLRSLQGHTYNVFRGTIADPWVNNETCLENEVPEPTASDAEDPLPGEAFYYLVAAHNSCGESTFADGRAPAASCAVADRDTDLDLLLDPGDNCPVVANDLQGDSDGDFVGDACDLCASTYDPGQGDDDGDQRGNTCDNCPEVANPDQIDGDGDLVGDLCDNCVSVNNPAQVDTDLDGLGDACDLDDDADGVDDTVDNCPLTPNAGQGDLDSDGFGDACDLDDDNDGLNDELDNCPRAGNAGQEDTDTDGFGDACDNCVFTGNPDQADTDLDTVGDVCDNCLEVANADQADFDADGAGDACDLDDDNDGTEDAQDCAPLDASASVPPSVVSDVLVEPGAFTTVSWVDQGPGFVYDVSGEVISVMRGEGGVGSASCLVDDHAGSPWSDERADPPADDGYYYLVRSQNACGDGSYGDDSAGDPRSPATACP